MSDHDDEGDDQVAEIARRSAPTLPSSASGGVNRLFKRSNSISIASPQANEAIRPALVARRGTIALGMGHEELERLHDAAQRHSERVRARHKSLAVNLLEGTDFDSIRGGRWRLRANSGASDLGSDLGTISSEWGESDESDSEDAAVGSPSSAFLSTLRKKWGHSSSAKSDAAAAAAADVAIGAAELNAALHAHLNAATSLGAQADGAPADPRAKVAGRRAASILKSAGAGGAAGAVAELSVATPAGSSASAGGSSAETLGLGTLSLLMVVCGCACQGPCDLLNSRDRGCADLISLAEYTYGIAVSAPAALRERAFRFPLLWHAGLAATGVSYTCFLNIALGSGLPMPVLITMKNGNLVANMFVGLALLRKRYSPSQVLAVVTVTAGLVLTALAGKSGPGKSGPGGAGGDDAGAAIEGASAGEPASLAAGVYATLGGDAMLGIGCLALSLVSRAMTGALQEAAFARFGRASVSEVLFMRNALGLPFFLAKAGGVLSHVHRWRGADVGGLLWPAAWVLLGVNLVMDYACKALMTRIISCSSALTATLVLTVQKFLSFAISLLLLSELGDPARTSPSIWLGSCAVLLGTTAYTTIARPPAPAVSAKGAKSKPKGKAD